MFTNMLLIVIGVLFAGLIFYMFFAVLFSKNEIPRVVEKNASGSPNGKTKGKFAERA